MDIRNIVAALEVARLGSFSLAAEGLYMSQSTVSRQVAALERHLGSALFTRTATGVLPTPAGDCFLPQAEVLLARAKEAEQAVRALVPQQQGPARHLGRGERMQRLDLKR